MLASAGSCFGGAVQCRGTSGLGVGISWWAVLARGFEDYLGKLFLPGKGQILSQGKRAQPHPHPDLQPWDPAAGPPPYHPILCGLPSGRRAEAPSKQAQESSKEIFHFKLFIYL